MASGNGISAGLALGQPLAGTTGGGAVTTSFGFWPAAGGCRADFNNSGGPPTVQDIFDFLGAYFAQDPRADVNGVGGVTVQDIFDFLTSYFLPCP